MDLLAVSLWAGAAAGVLAVVVAVARPEQRRRWLLVAAVLFLPIGILGILSIGALFLLVAAACIIGAVMGRPSRTRPSDRGCPRCDRSRPVARLVPVDGAETFDRLVDQGLVVPAATRGRDRSATRVAASEPVSQLVAEQHR